VTNPLSQEGQFVHGRPLSRRSPRLDNQEEPLAVTRRTLATLVALLATVSLLAACGSDDKTTAAADSTSTTGAAAFPVDVTASNGQITIADRPTRIVSLSPSSTETLFAIGAGDQVLAVDKNSNFPKDVPKGDLDAYEPNVEAIIAKKPDLVILSNDANDLVKSLVAVKVPVLLEDAPADLDGVLDQFADLGQATGHSAEAKRLSAQVRSDLEKLASESDAKGVTYYWELDQTFYSQTSKTFIGGLVGTLGLENIADGAGGASDYPQLSAEHIIKSDPGLIVLADTKCCQQTAATVAARPGWSGLKAIKGGTVVEMDDDIASRWGPRIVDLVRQVAKAAGRAKTAG
jgi:iron complex transport system substrate-binding protein